MGWAFDLATPTFTSATRHTPAKSPRARPATVSCPMTQLVCCPSPISAPRFFRIPLMPSFWPLMKYTRYHSIVSNAIASNPTRFSSGVPWSWISLRAAITAFRSFFSVRRSPGARPLRRAFSASFRRRPFRRSFFLPGAPAPPPPRIWPALPPTTPAALQAPNLP